MIYISHLRIKNFLVGWVCIVYLFTYLFIYTFLILMREFFLNFFCHIILKIAHFPAISHFSNSNLGC